MNFSEAMFYENYLTADFHTNIVISFQACLPTRQNGVENRDKAYFMATDKWIKRDVFSLALGPRVWDRNISRFRNGTHPVFLWSLILHQ